MGAPDYAAELRGYVHLYRGVGSFLILTGAVLVALGAVFTFLCSPSSPGACLPQPFQGVGVSVAGLGPLLVILGTPLVLTRWQFARKVGFCPYCEADTRRGGRFCAWRGRPL